MLRASLGSTATGIVKAGVGERRTCGVPTDNVVVRYGRVTASRITLTIRDLASPVRAEWVSAPLPRRDPGERPDNAGRVDSVALLEVHHGRLGRRTVEPGTDQRVPATAQLLLEALQVACRVALDELAAWPRGCGRGPDAAGLVRHRGVGRGIGGRRRRRRSRDLHPGDER